MGNSRQRAAAKRRRDAEEAEQGTVVPEPQGGAPEAKKRRVAEERGIADGDESGGGDGAVAAEVESNRTGAVKESRVTSGGGQGSKEFEVFVGGLSRSTTEDSLRHDFGECGTIVYCRVPMNDEGSARGIAFIAYSDKASMEKALEFNDNDYCGRHIQVRPSSEGSKGKGKDSKHKPATDDAVRSEPWNGHTIRSELEVFLHGVAPSATKESIAKDFRRFGEISNVTLPMTRYGDAAGIAFIEFTSKAACTKALSLNNTRPNGRLLNVRMSQFDGIKAREGRRHAGWW
eukprot:TRINITY_DN13560_c0_g1_i2.p1 TRINITY_DN13560_c0_g1~~TRINITY_DN13560_c0_g1_i2.p1  ORF type:complete len:288 (-),score=43.19 TRINITY_DN13560_c0_g1_i2:79-942(-)